MLRAELLKIRSHRLPWVVYGLYVLLQVVVSMIAALNTRDVLYDPTVVPFFVDGVPGLIFTTVVAGWIGGAEFGWGTWRIVLGRDDRRSLFFLTKVAVLVFVVALGTAVAVASGVLSGSAGAVLGGSKVAFDAVGASILAAALSQAVYALIAFSIGMATRSTAVAIAVGLGFFLIVQNILLTVRQVGPFLLSVAVETAASPERGTDPTDQQSLFASVYQIGTTRAWLTVVVWVAVFVSAAWLTFVKRDLAESD